MAVPLLDLQVQYQAIRAEIDAAVAEVFATQRFVFGPQVERLEAEIAAFVGARHAVAVSSGTDALWLTLRAAGIGPGDEVITAPFTFFATAGAIHNCGATPVFVDVRPDTFNIDVAQVEAAITSRTRAIIPVHLFGQCADMAPLMDAARRRGLFVLEDAAQALGAQYGERFAGALGDAGAISFFPSKNLGAPGDGGMVTTDDAALARALRLQRNHGQGETYYHEVVGTNSRLGELHAAVLRVKLRYLRAWTEARRENAAAYTARFSEIEGVTPPVEVSPCRHVYNQYTLRLAGRDAVRDALRARGVGCAVYYPVPLHRQQCFAHLAYGEGRFPLAEQACREVLSLPVFPELTQAQREEVIAAVSDAARG